MTFITIASILFIIGLFTGLFTAGITAKGREFLNDVWVRIRTLVGDKPVIEEAKYGCIQGPLEYRSSGGIVPVDGYITYFLDPTKSSKSITHLKALEGVEKAFYLIQPYMGKVRFKSVSDASKAQIVIGFYANGQTGLPQPFGSNTLAYAYLGNRTTAFNIVGDMFFNERFLWALSHGNRYVDFIKVMVHEALHSLGLHHQTIDNTGILFPSYNPNVGIKFSQDTINGLTDTYKNYPGPVAVVPDKPGVVPCPEDKTALVKQLTDKVAVLERTIVSTVDKHKREINTLNASHKTANALTLRVLNDLVKRLTV